MGGNIDKSKEWQMELLMEKLRSKSGQLKSFQETSKAVRMTMLDKRYALDSVEKSQHQKCLDALQHCIKVTSLQSMVERLESLTRQLGLKFMVGPSGVELFISSDMFYLEVILENNERGGGVRDVKVHHEGKIEQQSCAELVDCLSRQDFADFTLQLEGLASIYQLNAEKKIKCKAFSALQSLETDLCTLGQLQTFIKEPFNLIHKSPVGVFEKRKGGHAMRLTYLVSPYELIDPIRGRAEPLTVDRVISNKLGYSVTVCTEGSTAHKLPIAPIISVNRAINSNNSPSYAPLTAQNTAVIPACFSLRLSKPMSICTALTRRIQSLTQLECGDSSATHPLLSLITQHASDGQLDCANNRGLFVTLPDQQHCYFLTEGRGLQGVVVNSISFTHPAQVPSILALLRQQALFNTVLSSCIRPNSKQDLETMVMFEVNALSWQHLSISLEHPIEESMATADIDLSDISNVTCKIYGPGGSGEPCETTSELATKVLQRCLSIPVTMRAVIKTWEEIFRRKQYMNESENFSLPLGSDDPGGHKSSNSNPITDFNSLETKIKPDRSINGGTCGNTGNSHQNSFLNESMVGFPAFTNPDGSVISSMELNALIPAVAGIGPENKSKKHKRKGNDEAWKSPKRKSGEDCEMLLETSSSDSNSISTSFSHDATSEIEIPTPNSGLGFHSDLELSGLDATELINTDKTVLDYDFSANDHDLGDILSSSNLRTEHKTKKSREGRKSPHITDTAEKPHVSPSVSITPITPTASTPTSNLNSIITGMGLERRPGIEIIPIASATNTTLPSSITITPISASQSKSIADERNRERKNNKSRSDDRSKVDKKRKRKREEDTMRPPDKLPMKQDPLSKPVSVSIKTTDVSSVPTSPSNMTTHKFNSSPTHGRATSSSKQGSPTGKSSSVKINNVLHHKTLNMSGTKHVTTGMSSPKHHGASPKHQSISGTGKPSMSALKSATNVPSSKTSDTVKVKSSSSNKDLTSREKERKTTSASFISSTSSSSGAVSNSSSGTICNSGTTKIKSSSVKLKQLDLSTNVDVICNDSLASPTGLDLSKSALQGQARNRKGSLSAIVDKLKSAQHCGPEPEIQTNCKSGSSSNRENRTATFSSKAEVKNLKAGENKNSEYMVKPSSDGMKITINKTRTKDSSKSSSSSSASNKISSQVTSGSSSPKTHTGLKPGVNSGPASKKPQQSGPKSISGVPGSCNSPSHIKNALSSGNKLSSNKSTTNSYMSSSKSSSKLSNTSADRNRDNRPRSSMGKPEKSLLSGSKSDSRRSSPTIPSRDDTDGDRSLKLLSQHSKMDQVTVEGLIKQTLDTKFQIPKLSARVAVTEAENNKKNILKNSMLDPTLIRSNEIVKMNEVIKNDSMKYPMPLMTPKINEKDEKNVRNMTNVTNHSPLITNNTSTMSSPRLSLMEVSLQQTNISSSPNHLADTLEGDGKRYKKDFHSLSNSILSKDDTTAPNCKIAPPFALPSNVSFAIPCIDSETMNLSMKPPDASANAKFMSATALLDEKKAHTELAMKVVTTTSQEAAEMLLDFSAPKLPEHITKVSAIPERLSMVSPAHRNTPPMPGSPSVSIHIVKSPVASPLVMSSPHSASPCITDDDLMDEALVGISK